MGVDGFGCFSLDHFAVDLKGTVRYDLLYFLMILREEGASSDLVDEFSLARVFYECSSLLECLVASNFRLDLMHSLHAC